MRLRGEKIGEITSGSPAPFLKKNIALAYVPVEYRDVDSEVAVEIRGALVKAQVVPCRFTKAEEDVTARITKLDLSGEMHELSRRLQVYQNA